MENKEKELSMKNEKELTTVSQGLDTDKKNWGKFAGCGLEDVQEAKLKLGYLKLIQKMSPEVEMGAKAGEFWETSNELPCGDAVDIIIVKKTMDWAKFPAYGDTSEDTLFSNDGITWSNGELLNEDDKWRSYRFRFYVILKEDNEVVPYILIFKSTSKKTGEYISSMLKRYAKMNNEPIFARSFRLSSDKEKGDKGSYFVLKANINEGFNDDETLKRAYEARLLAEAHCTSYTLKDEDTIIKEGVRVQQERPVVQDNSLGLE